MVTILSLPLWKEPYQPSLYTEVPAAGLRKAFAKGTDTRKLKGMVSLQALLLIKMAFLSAWWGDP